MLFRKKEIRIKILNERKGKERKGKERKGKEKKEKKEKKERKTRSIFNNSRN